ncbi:helix-turn-helix domain-containing protein [Streptomyces sp. VRA16 Mangrove soil]|uniref:helix-turn-helix domain-containing protein n=1 Tax=Streptomyces sp. VRA16 Mangrove soil TaxID=2817434 RepID=UPI001A9FBF7B|nr:helix-turn-helix domain-containing protein [Streptomyces sp. VRA16 Mangrove soil]MBO1331406.1 helix-turn-helix domain-containing protein [Streptomyces sp. VRA16 Mangrove soil]
MGLEIESRPSELPYIERVWRSRSDAVGRMTSIAASHWELVFWEHEGQVQAAVMGPEPRACPAAVPKDATFFGISFALGTSMPHIPISRLVGASAEIPDVTRRSVWLKGSAWHPPDYDNAEAFVRRMVREGIVDRDPIVPAVLDGAAPDVSERTLQRRFVATTGLTRGAIRQIQRAREAAVLIQEGTPAQDVVHRLGYFDQPHLARSLTRYIGRTATRLSCPDATEPLSLLYKPSSSMPA